ncbi:MAG: hypothetical protein ALECFALPRED_001074 [Alectoria fallacina]|uniref:Uncharacterized protein n=1 Tax=Alectoria fallacina TaxID=1903189 RepID=A0A8H3EHZ5_9LECA|nr:MAG: hypothetical protein ALECFALPRED_001074 [Alectoria fallacina]
MRDKDNMLTAVNDTKAELDCHKDANLDLRAQVKNLTAQLQPSLRKRKHDQIDSEDEVFSPSHFDRMARRLEKAPQSAVNPTAEAASSSVVNNPAEGSVSPARPGSRRQQIATSAGPSINDARPLMNTAASRALGITRKEKSDALARWSWVGEGKGPAPNVRVVCDSEDGWVSGGTDVERSDILSSCVAVGTEISGC